MPITHRAGLDINDITIGTGPEPALMIHSSLSNARSFTRLATRLSDRFTLTGFDLPGHGASQDWTFAGDFQDAGLAIAETFVTQPVHLIGHSFGATVALRFAAKFPQLVKSMVLFEPVFFFAALSRDPDLNAPYEHMHQPFVDALEAGQAERAAELFLSDWGDGTAWNDLPEAFRASVIKRIPLVGAGVPPVHADRANMMALGGLDQVHAPTLLMRGAASHFMMEHIHAALCDTLPNACDHVLADAGHMLPVTHADACAKLADAFYSSL